MYRVHWIIDGQAFSSDYTQGKKAAQRIADRINNRFHNTPNSGAWIERV